ncbi:MAG: shikimate dehydrogenase [Clostridium sp.]|nr:shikimate dehydrogenase [Clostridium sp.]
MKELYGLVGYPLGHSFSRNYFNQLFAEEKINAEYVNFEISDISQFPDIVMKNTNLRGLNVTIPYKEKVIPFLDELSEEARDMGAVNVIRVQRKDGKTWLKGYNSDVIGFMDSIAPLLKPEHTKALILGTGGASKAVRYGLEKLGLKTMFVSRSERHGMLTYAQLTPALVREYSVIVNCTPCGMYPHTDEMPELPYTALTSRNLLYDLIYNPEQTLFLKKGAEVGAVTKNGMEMLLSQAKAGWSFWHE